MIRFKHISQLLFIIILCLLIKNPLKSQNDIVQNNSIYKNEIGINIYKIKMIGHGSNSKFKNDFANGITYKRMLRKMYLRGLIEFNYSAYKDESKSYIALTDKETKFSVGLEKRFLKNHVQPLFALDFTFIYNQLDYLPESNQRLKIFYTGFSPTIGIISKPIKRLSVTIETNAFLFIQLFYSTVKNNPSQKKYSIIYESSDINLIYNPISVLSLSYSFN